MHARVYTLLYETLQAWAFLKPVQAKIVPDYYNVIKFPMDLQTVRDVGLPSIISLCVHMVSICVPTWRPSLPADCILTQIDTICTFRCNHFHFHFPVSISEHTQARVHFPATVHGTRQSDCEQLHYIQRCVSMHWSFDVPLM